MAVVPNGVALLDAPALAVGDVAAALDVRSAAVLSDGGVVVAGLTCDDAFATAQALDKAAGAMLRRAPRTRAPTASPAPCRPSSSSRGRRRTASTSTKACLRKRGLPAYLRFSSACVLHHCGAQVLSLCSPHALPCVLRSCCGACMQLLFAIGRFLPVPLATQNGSYSIPRITDR